MIHVSKEIILISILDMYYVVLVSIRVQFMHSISEQQMNKPSCRNVQSSHSIHFSPPLIDVIEESDKKPLTPKDRVIFHSNRVILPIWDIYYIFSWTGSFMLSKN